MTKAEKLHLYELFVKHYGVNFVAENTHLTLKHKLRAAAENGTADNEINDYYQRVTYKPHREATAIYKHDGKRYAIALSDVDKICMSMTAWHAGIITLLKWQTVKHSSSRLFMSIYQKQKVWWL